MKTIRKAAKASNKPNKTQLRSQFVNLATEIRDMSKYEFVALLKDNNFEMAQQWIDELSALRTKFKSKAHESISHVVAKVIVDDKFVGYVSDIHKQSGSRGWGGRLVVSVTSDINEAAMFASRNEATSKLVKHGDMVVYSDDGVGYEYEPPYSKEHAGELDSLASEMNEMEVYYASSIVFEYIVTRNI